MDWSYPSAFWSAGIGSPYSSASKSAGIGLKKRWNKVTLNFTDFSVPTFLSLLFPPHVFSFFCFLSFFFELKHTTSLSHFYILPLPLWLLQAPLSPTATTILFPLFLVFRFFLSVSLSVLVYGFALIWFLFNGSLSFCVLGYRFALI